MGRRENGKGSIRKKTRGERIYWEGRYTNEEGKQKSICRDSESECRQALRKAIAEAELKKELKENDLAFEPDITLDKWVEICFTSFFTKLKPQTIEFYQRLYRNHWQQPMGQKRLTEIRREDVQTILSQMSEHSHSLIQNAAILLNKIYSYAIQERLIEKSPVKNVNKNFGISTKEKIALSEEQIQQFLVEAYKGRSKYYALAALIALNTGLRAGELLAITWSDFTEDYRFVHIYKTITHKKTLSTPKNEFSIRMVPIRDELREEILKYRNNLIEREEYFVDDPIICKYSSKSLKQLKIPFSSVSSFDSWIKGVVKKVQKQYPDFPLIASHCFRHTFVSRAIKYGMPLVYLQRIGGWGSMDVIDKVYSHIEFEQIYEA